MHISLCTLLNFDLSVLKAAGMAVDLTLQETKENMILWNEMCLVAEAIEPISANNNRLWKF